MESETPQRLSWTNSALYRTLSDTFPNIRTRQQRVLDVEKLADLLGMSREGLYKWFREGRILSPKGATRVIELANSEPHVSHLAAAGRTPPTKEDFARFLI